jgi:hypothetical protein
MVADVQALQGRVTLFRKDAKENEMTGQKQEVASGFDFEAWRRATEQLDVEALIDFYADDAQLRMVNRDAPPSSPRVLRGKAEIAGHLRDVSRQGIEIRVERETIGEDRVAYVEAIKYPDGTGLLCAGMIDVRNGKIVEDVSVQAWD